MAKGTKMAASVLASAAMLASMTAPVTVAFADELPAELAEAIGSGKHSDLSIDGGAGVDPDTRNYGEGTNDDNDAIDIIGRDTEVFLHTKDFGDEDENKQLRLVIPTRQDIVQTGSDNAVTDTYRAYNEKRQRAYFANLGEVDAEIVGATFEASNTIDWVRADHEASVAAAEAIDDYKALKPLFEGSFTLSGHKTDSSEPASATINANNWRAGTAAFADWKGEDADALFTLNRREELDLQSGGIAEIPTSYQMTTDTPFNVGTIIWTVGKAPEPEGPTTMNVATNAAGTATAPKLLSPMRLNSPAPSYETFGVYTDEDDNVYCTDTVEGDTVAFEVSSVALDSGLELDIEPVNLDEGDDGYDEVMTNYYEGTLDGDRLWTLQGVKMDASAVPEPDLHTRATGALKVNSFSKNSTYAPTASFSLNYTSPNSEMFKDSDKFKDYQLVLVFNKPVYEVRSMISFDLWQGEILGTDEYGNERASKETICLDFRTGGVNPDELANGIPDEIYADSNDPDGLELLEAFFISPQGVDDPEPEPESAYTPTGDLVVNSFSKTSAERWAEFSLNFNAPNSEMFFADATKFKDYQLVLVFNNPVCRVSAQDFKTAEIYGPDGEHAYVDPMTGTVVGGTETVCLDLNDWINGLGFPDGVTDTIAVDTADPEGLELTEAFFIKK